MKLIKALETKIEKLTRDAAATKEKNDVHATEAEKAEISQMSSFVHLMKSLLSLKTHYKTLQTNAWVIVDSHNEGKAFCVEGTDLHITEALDKKTRKKVSTKKVECKLKDMSNDRWAKIALNRQPSGHRCQGRPASRWADQLVI